MKREPLIIAATSDIAGKFRGKAFPLSQFEKRLKRGIGWTPTNVQITCFDSISDSPYGALGDLVLIPDPETRVDIEFDDGLPKERFVLGDIHETDGTPWECCTRSILKSALDRLQDVAGLRIFGAFEHEFHFVTGKCPLGSAYTTAGFRAERQFGEVLVSAIEQAKLAPDTFMKEYGINQYEVTVGPVLGVRIADHAAILRELVHIVAERLQLNASFTPLRHPDSVGNGVHIHLSIRNEESIPVTYDSTSPHGLSPIAGQFVAGVLKYLDRIVALTAPSVVSYKRLIPHRWSASFNNLGYRDREASVRICPVSDLSDVEMSEQFNFEFRAADAAASPYLALAAIVHSGVQGIQEGLDYPEVTEEDLSLLSPNDLAGRGLTRLPQSLETALANFEKDRIVTDWFPRDFVEIYVKHKQGEIAYLADSTEAEICDAYEAVY